MFGGDCHQHFRFFPYCYELALQNSGGRRSQHRRVHLLPVRIFRHNRLRLERDDSHEPIQAFPERLKVVTGLSNHFGSIGLRFIQLGGAFGTNLTHHHRFQYVAVLDLDNRLGVPQGEFDVY